MYCNGRILKPLFWIVLFCPLLFHVYILCIGSGKELKSPSPQCWLGHRHATQAKPLDRPRDFHSWSWKGHIGGIQGNWRLQKNEFTAVPLTARVVELVITVSYKNGSDVRLRTVAVGRKGGRLCVLDSSQKRCPRSQQPLVARASQEWPFPGFLPCFFSLFQAGPFIACTSKASPRTVVNLNLSALPYS